MKISWLTAAAAFVCMSTLASAQTPEAQPSQVEPPKVIQEITPQYPESKRAQHESASVALLLTIDESGHVTDATIDESAGPEFDAAALDAAKQLLFEPAKRAGKAVSAKIRYRFTFELAAEPAPSPEPAPLVAPPAPTPAPAAPPPPPAPAESADAGLDISVEGERPPREPTVHVLQAQEIAKIPGNNGDALRSIGSMPGVARPPGGDGLLIVRGSAPQDTQVFVDGAPVPIAYHFGGLSSVLPSEILERIDFYPGNFGAEFGRAMGGIIDVGVRSPRKDRLGGLLQFDLIDGRLLAEGPINDSTRFMIGGRRSWLDAWLGPVLKEAGVGVTAAPVYYDYQAMLEHDLTRDTTLRLFAFGTDDRLRLLLKSPDAQDPAIGGNFALHTRFWRVQGRAETRLSSQVKWTSQVSVGNGGEDQSIGQLYIKANSFTANARSDLRAQVSKYLTAIAGVDLVWGKADVSLRLPPLDYDSGETGGPLFGRQALEQKGSLPLFRPAGYLALEVRPLPGLKIMPGVRTDYTYDSRHWTADPRIAVRYDVHRDFPRTTLKGGLGLFHQPPQPYESTPPFGQRSVRSNKAVHSSVGVEQEFTRQVELSVELFDKELSDLVVSQLDAESSANGIVYRNVGTGRSYGGELLLRYKPDERFFGWVAYTLSRSERKDGPGQPTHLFDYDQTHILTALASVKLGRGWQLGARFRYITGTPYTPYIGGVMDYDAGSYAPISAKPNSARTEAFHQLDLRVDKEWHFGKFALSTYLDLQNAYSHQNAEGQTYNYNYSKSGPVAGIPILPVFGVRGEL